MKADNDINPGEVMRQRREERGLSIEDVAKSLNLTTRVITALEENEYKKLPGITYTRGYIRNYAHLLDLAPDPLMDALMVRIKDETIEIVESLSTGQEDHNNSRTVTLGTFVVGAIIIGLSIVWWQGYDREPSRRTEANTASTLTADVNNMTSTDTSLTGEDKSAISSETGGKSSSSTTESLSEMIVEGGKGPLLTSMVISETPQGSNRKTAIAEESEASNLADAARPAVRVEELKPAKDNKIKKIRPVQRLRIVLQVKEASWADIRDAGNNKLLYETVTAGRVITVEGIAPFSIFLGNPDGVDIVLNGKLYNIDQHKQGLVARFKLGANSQ